MGCLPWKRDCTAYHRRGNQFHGLEGQFYPISTYYIVTLFHVQDEAYELGRQWAKLYEPDSVARQAITQIMDSYYLMNVVHNDYKKPEAIFEPFLKAGAECAAAQEAKQSALTNGHTNGLAN